MSKRYYGTDAPRSTGPHPDPMSDWNTCDHWWETKPGDWDSAFKQMQCLRCKCPGEQYEDGSIYWPAT